MASATSYASSTVYGAIVAKVCSRSHGQPRCGSRSCAISASSADTACSASVMRQRSDAHPVKSHEHPGRGPPDVTSAIGNVVELHLLAGETGTAAAHAVIGGIEDVTHRHLECGLNLAGVERQRKVRLHGGHHRRHTKAGHHHVVRKIADHRDEALLETDLLTRLAQGRGARAGVSRLNAPARKTD